MAYNKEYYHNGKGKESQHNNYVKNREKIIARVREREERLRNEDPNWEQKEKDRQAKYRNKNKEKLASKVEKSPFRYKLYRTKTSAIRRELEFTITEDDIRSLWEKQSGICYYSKKPMDLPKHGTKTSTNTMSIDRIDSAVGYTPDNVVLCRWIMNVMKNEMDIETFYEEALSIVNNVLLKG